MASSSNKRKADSKPLIPPSFLITFGVLGQQKPPRNRARFDPNRRREVKAVRKRRACLRCSLLKIRCSDDDLCMTCGKLALVARGYERQTLSFSGCIRTRLREVSIFEGFLPPPEFRDIVREKAESLALTAITLHFTTPIKWELNAMVDDIVEWLNNPRLSTTSKVGTFSSPSFQDLLCSSLDDNARINFQRMIYAESLAYTQPTTSDKHPLSILDLGQIGATAGHEFLKCLELNLKPSSLQNMRKVDFQALFLLLTGTILAVGYTRPFDASDIISLKAAFNDSPGYSTQFEAMQDHLCRILAHYIVYIGALLKLPIADHVEQFILEAAHAIWDKEGAFQWTTYPKEEIGSDGGVDWAFDDQMFENAPPKISDNLLDCAFGRGDVLQHTPESASKNLDTFHPQLLENASTYLDDAIFDKGHVEMVTETPLTVDELPKAILSRRAACKEFDTEFYELQPLGIYAPTEPGLGADRRTLKRSIRLLNHSNGEPRLVSVRVETLHPPHAREAAPARSIAPTRQARIVSGSMQPKCKCTVMETDCSLHSRPAAVAPTIPVGEQSIIWQALAILAEELGCHISELVDPVALSHVGVDSLMSLTISARLREELGLHISDCVFNSLNTVSDFKQYLRYNSTHHMVMPLTLFHQMLEAMPLTTDQGSKNPCVFRTRSTEAPPDSNPNKERYLLV